MCEKFVYVLFFFFRKDCMCNEILFLRKKRLIKKKRESNIFENSFINLFLSNWFWSLGRCVAWHREKRSGILDVLLNDVARSTKNQSLFLFSFFLWEPKCLAPKQLLGGKLVTTVGLEILAEFSRNIVEHEMSYIIIQHVMIHAG